MRRVVLIEDHTGFQISMARAALAGGALLLLQAVLTLPPWGAGWLGVLLLGAALRPPRSLRQGSWLLLCSALGGGATACSAAGWGGATMPAVGFSLAVGLSVLGDGALPGWQQALLGLATMLLTIGARLVPQALQTQDFIVALPGQLGALLGGVGMGLVVGSSSIVGALRVRTDSMDPELAGLLPAPQEKDEIAHLVHQAAQAYYDATEALSPGEASQAQAQGAAEDLVKKIARFGKRWREIDQQAQRSDRAALEARLADLTQRQTATTDEQVRAEYGRALTALERQLQYLREIDAGRERAVARLHHQVATLERLRLAALRHRSVDVSRLGDELKSVVEDLNRAGADLDHAAEAIAELPV